MHLPERVARWWRPLPPRRVRLHVSVIIVSYNTRELTLDCLCSVYEQTRDVSFEVIVVDNASLDGSAEAIAAHYPQVRLITSEQNLGFAAANNLAAQHAQGAWLLLLNPDTVVLDRAIDRLVAFAEQQQARAETYGIFGGRTLFADSSLNPTSCWGRPTLRSMFCLASGISGLFKASNWAFPEEMRDWKRDSVREVDIVTGCFFLLRREFWERLDGLDPAFFMYGEEADLCLRARELGVKCMICPDAKIIHYGGASEKIRADKMVRLFTAKAQLFRRHWSARSFRLGILLLDCWAYSRMTGYTAVTWFRPDRAASCEIWKQVWHRRNEWRNADADPE